MCLQGKCSKKKELVVACMELDGKYSYVDWNIRAVVKYTKQTEGRMHDDWMFFKRYIYKVDGKNVETK
jgi:outer membrane protease